MVDFLSLLTWAKELLMTAKELLDKLRLGR